LSGPAWAPPLLSLQTSRLEELAGLVDEQRRLADRQRRLVVELVAVDTPWPRIAAALGVSRQAARQHFMRTHARRVADG
jgi:predicted ArsR family transcriptional regulator